MQAAASDTKTNNRRDSDDMKTIIAASSNAHKIKEIQAIMDKFGMKVVSRDDAGVPPFAVSYTHLDVYKRQGMGSYPEGIEIGSVKSVKYNSDKLMREIIVEPAVSFESLRKVAVII